MPTRTKILLVLLAAGFCGVIYAGSEALARGGGGRGAHGGMNSSWHGLGLHNLHGMSGHPQFPFKGQHSHSKLNFAHNKHQQHNMQQHMNAQGQWHSVPGFGSHGQKWANMPGVWHKVSGFGNHGQFNSARNFQRDWQAGGDGLGYAGSVGDLCLSPGACQGVWQVVPQGGGQPKQSRSLQKGWRIDGEL